MKKSIVVSLVAFIMLSFQLFSQAPESVNYQAVLRNSNGDIITNQSVSLQFTLRSGSATGAFIYVEDHSVQTNAFGLVNLQIGTGVDSFGTFANIDWGSSEYWLQIEMDENGGSNYTLLGSTKLISVPYALHAKTAESVINADDADADPQNELQTLDLRSDTLEISNGNYVILNSMVNTDDQNLTLQNNSLSIEDGNSVDLSSYLDNTDAQVLSISNDTIYLGNGGFVKLPSGVVDTDDQALSLSNDTLFLQDGGYVILPENFSGDYNDLANTPNNLSDFSNDLGFVTTSNDLDSDTTNELQDLQGFLTGSELTIAINDGDSAKVNLAALVDDADADSTNELQLLSLSGDTIFLSDGGSVILPAGTVDTDDQTLSISNDSLQIEDGNRVDLSQYLDNTDAQVLSINGDTVFLSNGGYVVLPENFSGDYNDLANTPNNLSDFSNDLGFVTTSNDLDSDTTNELQDLQGFLTGSELTIAINDGDSAKVNLADLIDDADADSTNELQILSLSGDTVFLSDGGYVVLPAGTVDTDDQTLSINGDTLSIADGNSVILTTDTLSIISDADNDTKIQVEESADEDIIRFDMAGTEFFRMDNGRLEVSNTGRSVFMGQGAGANDDFTDNRNVAIGHNALNSNTNGRWNVGVGYETLKSNTTGTFNTAIGYQTLDENTTGDANSGFGDGALTSNTKGFGNSAVGNSTLAFNTNGNQNTALGRYALLNNSTGSFNVAVGASAQLQGTGQRNTSLGYRAGYNMNGLTNATAIGADAEVDCDSCLVLGNAAKVGIGTSTPDTTFHLVGKMKYVDGTQAGGYVLTSDSAGNASWQNAVSAADTIWGLNGNGTGVYSLLGNNNQASGTSSFAVGRNTTASGDNSTAMGFNTMAISQYSTALGYNTAAGGYNSTALGYYSTAGGYNSTALGYNTSASGWNSTALGYFSTASGENSTTMGNNTNANGESSTAMGYYTTASSDYSTAMGYNTNANGESSTSMGRSSTANGNRSAAIGSEVLAEAHYSIALGRGVNTLGESSVAMGWGSRTFAAGEIALGSFNTEYVANNSANWNATDRAFVVGNGVNNANRSDAMVILKNGNTGFGISTPDTTFHLVGKMKYVDGTQASGNVLTSDANGNASWQQPQVFTTDTLSIISDADNDTKIEVEQTADEDHIRISVAGTEALTIDNLGNSGFGTSTPDTTVHIVGKLKYEDGTQGDGYVLTSDADGNASWAEGGSVTYTVGDFAHGGIVFWVDETGQHGLVCAKEDQSAGVRWYAGTHGNTQAKGDGPYAGKANTSIIIAAQVAIGDDGSTYAARICNELQITEGGKTYGDWYLPSKEELNLMYQNRVTIGATATANSGSGFASAYYWSSTEYNTNNAWIQIFYNGNQGYYTKHNTIRVRAVRAF
ncbi:MAG: DUF1566 domain-containing protein [Chitinophagales bacterium]